MRIFTLILIVFCISCSENDCTFSPTGIYDSPDKTINLNFEPGNQIFIHFGTALVQEKCTYIIEECSPLTLSFDCLLLPGRALIEIDDTNGLLWINNDVYFERL